jgi:hypothetical protein
MTAFMPGLIFIVLVAIVLITLSLRVLLKAVRRSPIGIFALDNLEKRFEIKSSGYYSISILGAGHIREVQRVSIKLTLNTSQVLAWNVNEIPFRFTQDGKMGVEYWGFRTDTTGNCELIISNPEGIEAKESMLLSKRLFQSPIDHSKLKILIYQSARPIHKLFSILAIIAGIGLILFCIVNLYR